MCGKSPGILARGRAASDVCFALLCLFICAPFFCLLSSFISLSVCVCFLFCRPSLFVWLLQQQLQQQQQDNNNEDNNNDNDNDFILTDC